VPTRLRRKRTASDQLAMPGFACSRQPPSCLAVRVHERCMMRGQPNSDDRICIRIRSRFVSSSLLVARDVRASRRHASRS
jgi:hypothetical protein